MRFANTVELKNKTNKILKEVMEGNPVIITYRGKPAAAITSLKEGDIEDFRGVAVRAVAQHGDDGVAGPHFLCHADRARDVDAA